MKVVLLSTYDVRGGGATHLAFRLLKSLAARSIDVSMAVMTKDSTVQNVVTPRFVDRMNGFLRKKVESFLVSLYPKRNSPHFSLGLSLGGTLVPKRLPPSASVYHAHWINDGFLGCREMASIPGPLIWTFQDSWAMTGGCHSPWDCSRFESSCGKCPVLGSNSSFDLSRLVFLNKKRAWRNFPMTVVASSHWLSKRVRRSPLFSQMPLEVIPNGIDLSLFRPIEKSIARDIFQIPDNKFYLLAGGIGTEKDLNKGMDLLAEALGFLRNLHPKKDIELLFRGVPHQLLNNQDCIPIRVIDTLQDELSLSLLYSAADLFICPSRQENLPNMIMEAMGCGTPAIAFDVGGNPELIEDGKNGFLVSPFDTKQLANLIHKALNNEHLLLSFGRQGREKVSKTFNLDIMTTKYLELYEKTSSNQ